MKEVQEQDVHKYGIGRLEDGHLMEIVEKPSLEEAPSNVAVFTPYITNKKFLENLHNVEPDPSSGEIYPWPALQEFMENKDIIGYVTKHPLWDTGNPQARLKANNELGHNPDLVSQ